MNANMKFYDTLFTMRTLPVSINTDKIRTNL